MASSQAPGPTVASRGLLAGTELWSQLFFNKPPAAKPDNFLPPLTPVDKANTSVRILLHDTQANFEKFSIHVNKLISLIGEAKQEVKLVHTLFERDRESLSNDIIDLVNRCQTEIQKSLGAPSQVSELTTFRQDTDRRLQNLDHRLDAIQMFNQTHAQALQSQMQALQALQEQQTSLLYTVLPMLPLVQAIPLHIESTRNALNEAVQKLAVQVPPTSLHHQKLDTPTRKRSRSASHSDGHRIPPSSPASAINKCMRSDPAVSKHASDPSPTFSSRRSMSKSASLQRGGSINDQYAVSRRPLADLNVPRAQRSNSKPISTPIVRRQSEKIPSILPSSVTTIGQKIPEDSDITQPSIQINSSSLTDTALTSDTAAKLFHPNTASGPAQSTTAACNSNTNTHVPSPALAMAPPRSDSNNCSTPPTRIRPSTALGQVNNSTAKGFKEGRRFIPLCDSDDDDMNS